MSQMLVGIDVSLKSHHVQFMNGTGNALASFSIPNDQSGADTLLKRLLNTALKSKCNCVQIGMEATSNLGWHLAHYLQDQLQGYELQSKIYVLNARKVSRFKKGYDTLPKNDRIDAWVIADHLRFGRLPHAMQDMIQYEALQRSETLTSIKGIGPVYAAGIIAEICGIERFSGHNALAKYAGLVWNKHQSGEFEAEDTRRLRSGNKYLRYYLVEASDKIRQHDSEYKAFYKTKFDEVPKHKHKRALVLTARKLVRLVYTLLNTNQLYTPPERRG